jgi:hypothetical protein
MAMMQLRFDGGTVTRVSFDEALTILTSAAYQFQIESPLSLVKAGEPPRVFEPANPDATVIDLVGLLRKRLRSTDVLDDGTLKMQFSNDCELVVPASPDFEAWQIIGPHDQLMVCTPGGELAVWGEMSVQD